MKKQFWSILAILFVAMLSINLTSCGDDNDDTPKNEKITEASIIGTWKYTKIRSNGGSISQTYTFKSDGTYSINWVEVADEEYFGTERGTYEFNVNEMTLTLTTTEGEKLGKHSPLIVKLEGNQLTLTEKDGDVRGPMTKQE